MKVLCSSVIVFLFLLSSIVADIMPGGGFTGFSETEVKKLGEISIHTESISSKDAGYITLYRSITFLANEEEIDFIKATPGDTSCWKVRYAIQRYSPKISPGKTVSITIYIEGSWMPSKAESNIVFQFYFRLKKERVAVIYTDILPFPVTDYYRATNAAPQKAGVVFLPLPLAKKITSTWGSIKSGGGR